ncbi:MAG: hypothetical protein DRP65_12530, partial [Planctomycetota bacterium]
MIHRVEKMPRFKHGLCTSPLRMTMSLLLMCSCWILICSAPAIGGTYYVSVDGTGTGENGSQSNPYTLAESISYASANPSETIVFLMASGSYGFFSYDTTRTAWVSWQADAGQTPIISASGTAAMEIGSGGVLRDLYVRLEGITIETTSPLAAWRYLIRLQMANHVAFADCNIRGAGTFNNEDGTTGLSLNYCQNIELNGCTVDGPGSERRRSFDIPINSRNAEHITIDGCDISGGRYGILAWGSDWVIRNCKIHDSYSDGIIGNCIQNLIIEDCEIYDILAEFYFTDDIGGANYNNSTLTITQGPGSPSWAPYYEGYVKITASFGGQTRTTSHAEITGSTETTITIASDDAYGQSADPGSVSKVEVAWGHHLDCIQFWTPGGYYPGNTNFYFTKNITIRRNKMYNCTHHAMLWNMLRPDPVNEGHDYGSANFLIENNLIYDMAQSGLGDQSIAIEDTKGIDFVNNTILGYVDLAHDLEVGSFVNNIVDELSIPEHANQTTIESRHHNLINTWNARTPYDYDDNGEGVGSTIYANDTNFHALFNNYAADDFSPSAGSDTIDAGTTQQAPTVDICGEDRKGIPDIGCYESGSTGIIVDHTAVEEFDSIPDVWLDEVKNMLIQVVGESHAA